MPPAKIQRVIGTLQRVWRKLVECRNGAAAAREDVERNHTAYGVFNSGDGIENVRQCRDAFEATVDGGLKLIFSGYYRK
jgi:hypothetical protein